MKNHAAFVEIGTREVGVEGRLLTLAVNGVYLWAQFHLLIVFIHARKGLIILGNLYLLIGGRAASGFFCDSTNKGKLQLRLYFRSVKRIHVWLPLGFENSRKTDRLLWSLDGGNIIIIPCIMCAQETRTAKNEALKYHLHNGWRVFNGT